MARYVHSKRLGLGLLSAAVQHDCGLRDDCVAGNTEQWYIENAGPASEPKGPFSGKVLCPDVLPTHGNGRLFGGVCSRWYAGYLDNGYYGNIARSLSSEMVRGAVSDNASMLGGDVGNYGVV